VAEKRRRNVSIAADIVDGESQTYGWIEVLDSDGNRWRYVKKGPAPDRAAVHVQIGPPLKLLFDADGIPRLRQEGAGLPKKMVMGFPNPMPQMGGVGGAWSLVLFEYEQ
jgi:hypothetical protein